MQIRLLNDKNISELENYLAPYQSKCMFICSNLKASGVEYYNADYHGEYLGHYSTCTNKLDGIIVHYWNGNVMMHAPSMAILKHLAYHFKNNIKRPISGILGPNKQAELIIKILGLSNALFNINRNEGLYEMNLKNLNNIDVLHNFSIVRVSKVSKNVIISWRKAYNIESLGAPNNNHHLQELAEQDYRRLLKSNDCWVLLNDKTPVAMSGFNARLENMVQIGYVWTPPEHRNKGFARMLLTNILVQESNKGIKKAILFTENPAAIKVYQFIGFKKIGNYRLALLKKQY